VPYDFVRRHGTCAKKGGGERTSVAHERSPARTNSTKGAEAGLNSQKVSEKEKQGTKLNLETPQLLMDHGVSKRGRWWKL